MARNIFDFVRATPGLDLPDVSDQAQSTINNPPVMPVAGTESALTGSVNKLRINHDDVEAEIARLTAYRDELRVSISALDAALSVIKQHKGAGESLEKVLSDLHEEAARGV